MLYLNSDLRYKKTGLQDTDLKMTENDEYLLCYALEPAQSISIEPNPGLFLSDFIFAGVKEDAVNENDDSIEVSMPKGKYLFSQSRNTSYMKKTDWLNMAIEMQKDGLWERYTLENRLYVRFLFEDGMYVTQLFRSVKVL